MIFLVLTISLHLANGSWSHDYMVRPYNYPSLAECQDDAAKERASSTDDRKVEAECQETM